MIFDPQLCCAHEWRPATRHNGGRAAPAKGECCTLCHSTCQRNKAGVIVEYQRGDADRPAGSRPLHLEADWRR